MAHRMGKRNEKKENASIYTDCDNRISLNEVTQQARLERVIDYLVTGMGRIDIREKLIKEWNMSRVTANTIIDEAMIYLSERTATTPDQVKKLNYNRLENIIGDADTIQDKCRVIDLENKMYGVYETNVNVTSDNTFKFDIGVDGIN